MSDDLEPQFPALPPAGTFLIIGTVTCVFCRKAESVLRKHPARPPVVKHTLRTEPEKAMIKARGFSTVPVIYHGDKLIGGFDALTDYLAANPL